MYGDLSTEGKMRKRGCVERVTKRNQAGTGLHLDHPCRKGEKQRVTKSRSNPTVGPGLDRRKGRRGQEFPLTEKQQIHKSKLITQCSSSDFLSQSKDGSLSQELLPPC